MSRPFAVFDIDGTVIRWQLYHAIGDELARRGVIAPEAFGKVRAARMSWKKRTGSESFGAYERELIKVFDQALPGLPVATLTAAAEAVLAEYKDQVYTYTRDLIRQLKGRRYLLFALSGSPDVIVQALADYYGFDDCAATHYAARGGRFTGDKQLSVGQKPRLLQTLIDKHGAARRGSLGVGDTEGDIDMLALTDQPTAFNPTKKLFQHARARRWKIVIERKNVVYELEPRSGEYQLQP